MTMIAGGSPIISPINAGSGPATSNQKALRKRVAALARKGHNRVCCDCPEKAPTWAAFITPSKQAPLGSQELVAFICFNCAGGHRQLGPLVVSKVKNIALDEWTEEDVELAERSGNKRVNAIYENSLHGGEDGASLVLSPSAAITMVKPIAGAHETTHHRFIREKYEALRWYSKSAHVKHNHKDHDKQLHHLQSPSTPSSPSKSGRRTSLMQFLKTKDTAGGGSSSPLDHKFPAALGASMTEGTLSTALESRDSQPQQSDNQSVTANTVATNSTSRRDSIGAFFSPFGKKKTVSRGNLSNSASFSGSIVSNKGGSIFAAPTTSSPSSPQGLEPSSGSTKKVNKGDIASSSDQAKQSSLRLSGKHDSYRDPRREAFHRSKSSLDFNMDDDDDDDANGLEASKKETSKTVTPSHRTSKLVIRPRLVATKSMPSPANSRASLYSKRSSTGTRGRSTSRQRGEGIAVDHVRQRSSSRGVVLDKKDDKRHRGRSKSTGLRRDATSVDPDESRASKTKTTTSSNRRDVDRTSRTSSREPASTRRSSSRTPSPIKAKTEKARTSASPSTRRHRERSSSRVRGENGDISSRTRPHTSTTTSRIRSHRSPSATGKKTHDGATDPCHEKSRSSSRRERSRSGSRLRSREKSVDSTELHNSTISEGRRHRSPSTGGKTRREDVTDRSSGKNTSTSSSSRERGRSSSRLRSREKLVASMDHLHDSNVSKTDTKRTPSATRERSRSRTKANSLEQLLVCSNRRKRDTTRSVVSAPTVAARDSKATKTKAVRKERSPKDSVVPLNDLPSAKRGNSSFDKFDDNVSLSIDSIFSAESPSSSKDVVTRGCKSTNDMLKDGEESFQVLSNGSSRNLSFAKKVRASSKERPRREYVRGGDDKYENARRRMSHTKAAQLDANRSSRKSDIFAALDREEDELAGPLMRLAPGRSASGDGGVGRSRPLIMRVPPNRSTSDAARTLRSVAPKLHISRSNHGSASDLGDVLEEKDLDQQAAEAARADFDKSFSMDELLL